MNMSIVLRRLSALTLVAASLELAACNGNDGPTAPLPPTPVPTAAHAPSPTPQIPTPTPAPQIPTPTPPPPSQPTLNFVVTDVCNDGRGLYVRLWDETTGQSFPGGDQAYVVPVGGTGTATATANPGDKICYGAETNPPTTVYWGVGVDNNHGCDHCCYNIPLSGGPVTVPVTLTCPNGSGVGADLGPFGSPR